MLDEPLAVLQELVVNTVSHSNTSGQGSVAVVLTGRGAVVVERSEKVKGRDEDGENTERIARVTCPDARHDGSQWEGLVVVVENENPSCCGEGDRYAAGKFAISLACMCAVSEL